MNEFMARLLLLFSLLLSARLDATGPKRQREYHLTETTPGTSEPPVSFILTDEQRRWAEKAVKRYAAAQEKKWQHWNEAMFERK